MFELQKGSSRNTVDLAVTEAAHVAIGCIFQTSANQAVQDAILNERMQLQRKKNDCYIQEVALTNMDLGFVADTFFHGASHQFGNTITRTNGHGEYLQAQRQMLGKPTSKVLFDGNVKDLRTLGHKGNRARNNALNPAAIAVIGGVTGTPAVATKSKPASRLYPTPRHKVPPTEAKLPGFPSAVSARAEEERKLPAVTPGKKRGFDEIIELQDSPIELQVQI